MATRTPSSPRRAQPRKPAAKTKPATKRTSKPRKSIQVPQPAANAPTTKRRGMQRFKHIKPATPPRRLPSALQITRSALQTFWLHKGVFLGITAVYGVLSLIMVQGLANTTDVGGTKQQLDQVFHGHFAALGSSLSVFALLVGSTANSSNPTAGTYQLLLALMTSLAIIWALRQVLAGGRIRIRDAYYRGMYPLVPYVLVILVIGLQLLPLLIGTTAYALVITNDVAVHAIEKLLWAVVAVGLGGLSFYMITASVFALYIVTLPDMAPFKALRTARELVRFRRWSIVRKLLFLPLLLAVLTAIVMVPVIIFATPLTQWVFFVLTLLGLLAIHTYMYTLYRELLDE